MRIFKCLIGILLSFALCAGSAFAEGSSELGGTGASPLESPLVVPEAQPLLGSESVGNAEEARLASPEAVAAREESQTEWEGLDVAEAAGLADHAFPGVIESPDGGLQLPEGESVTEYPTDDAAEVRLSTGGRGVAESLAPIAVEVSPDQRVPVDLGLVEASGAFEPLTPVVGVRIPKQLRDGVSLVGTGVSLTPVDASGVSVGGSEGQVDGAVVFYGGVGVGSDVDMAVKPSTLGFSEEVFLRSDRSPSVISFRVGLPQGARVVQVSGGSGVVEVVKEGATIATIASPSAEDAAGTSVPVSMSLSGDTLVLSVDQGSAEYKYPIAVDPEVKGEDPQLVETSGGKRSNWKFWSSNAEKKSSSEYKFGNEPDEGPNKDEGPGKGYLETKGIAEYAETEKAFWAYQTKGVSKIYEFNAKTEGKNKGAEIESFLELEGGGSSESKEPLSTELKNPEYGLEAASPLCGKNGTKVECAPAAGAAGNVVRFQQSVQKKPSNYGFSDSLHEGTVYLAEPENTHSETKFNTTSLEVEGEVEKKVQKRPNALYGSGGWLSKYQDAIEPVAKDGGIGVAKTRLEYEDSPGKWESIVEHNYLEKENGCEGVQCYPEHKEYWTLSEKLPNGEDKIRYRAEEALSGTESLESEAESTKTVKVDTSPPHRIAIVGLPFGNELSERAYPLTVYATDGEGTTVPSSGVKSIALYIDNVLVGIDGGAGGKEGTEGKCTTAKGECTASAKWTINGAELGAGHHSIQIVAFDNAGNEGRLPGGGTEISIRHSTPVALGPGSVDLESGDFTLGATDVSMGSGLTVSRAYSSRAIEAGDEGPLGPEWSMSLANTESLVELVDGSLLMTAANGGQAIFAKPSSGIKCEAGAPFESPPGDSNLKMWCEENKETKQRVAYYLEDAANHTKVKFALPPGGTKVWAPTVQNGAVATDTVTYQYQAVEQHTEYALPEKSGLADGGITAGPNGSVWFTQSRVPEEIGEIAPNGAVTEFPLSSDGPSGITEGPDGNVWFTLGGSSKIGRITPSGTVTEYGSELPDPVGITPGPAGESALWFTEASGGKIGRITTLGTITGEYSLPSKESDPQSIATGPEGNLWFTENGANKIGVMTTAGTISNEYVLPEGSDPNRITAGPPGEHAVWFTEGGTHKIGRITSSGEKSEFSVSGASNGPNDITAGPDGNIWFTEEGTHMIGKITPSGTITEYAPPNNSEAKEITAGPDGNLWFTDEGYHRIGMITTSGQVTEPKEARAPQPQGVSCEWKEKPTEMHLGCRALEFKYDTGETTAKGEGSGEWGSYHGRLERVSMVAYNPAPEAKEMQEVPVAEYSYDSLGRLRAEWDPRVSPALKMTYGYDREGHITGLTPPGQESWALTYGTIAGDAGTGRLLKVTQAPVSAGLWKGEGVTNTEAPAINRPPVVGVRDSVSNGKWSGSPIAYGYQWEDCGSNGAQCTSIAGATNPNYTPVVSDEGHRLVAMVTATNGGDSLSATSAASNEASNGEAENYPVYKLSQPYGITSGPDGNIWITQNIGRISKITPGGEVTEYKSSVPSGPRYITAGPAKENALWFTASTGGENKIGKITTSGSVTTYAVEKGAEVQGITAGPDGNLWFAMEGVSKIGRITPSGTIKEYSLPSGSKPYGMTAGPEKENALWFTESGASKIGRITTSGEIKEYPLEEKGLEPQSIVAGADGNLWFTQSGGWRLHGYDGIGRITTSGKVSGYTEQDVPSAITAGPEKENALWFTENDGTNRVAKITTSGAVTEYNVAAGSFPREITAGPEGEKALWFTEQDLPGVGKLNVNPTEGTSEANSPGWTIDYNVLLQGANAPHQMGENETTHQPEPEKWGQSDDPVEATAITPPDSPQGWPASSYKRATVYYLDEQGRQVNVAQPSNSSYGAISTTEYNEFNDVIRTLTADSRETALKEGCESESNCASAKKAKLLSTENTYNGEGEKESETREPGTQLILSRGPEHMVKYVAGEEQYEPGEKPKEAMARSLTKYYYNEGAPTENPRTKETYDLVTKTQNYAELTSENNNETVDARTTKTFYSGQDDLGWELRAPTSVTVNPGSLNLTTTTEYYEAGEAAGQVKETRGAGAEGTLTYASKFGETGTEAGKLKDPFGGAIDSKGDLWIADEGNSRIEEFGQEGKYITTFGKAGSEPGQLKEPKGIAIDSKGNIWVAEAGNNRIQEFSPEGKSLQVFGKAGSETGDLSSPKALAIDSKGDIWVADTANNRIEEFSSEGKYLSTFGKAGSEPGQLKEPKGIAIDSKGNIWVADTANNRIQEFSPEGKLLSHFGTSGSGAGQLSTPFGLAFDGSGNLWVTDNGNNRIQEFSSSGAFMTQVGWKGSEAGQLKEPRAVMVASKGELWVTDYANNRLEEWSKGPNAHDSKTIYYTSEENKEYSSCGKHAEWAGLVCETLPAKQPELAGLPKLPVTTTTYNMWDEPETIEETFGLGTEAKKRRTKDSYDAAGRLTSGEENVYSDHGND